MAALHRGEHRADGHQRLAGADVALQQTMHRMRTGKVVLDLGDRPPLGRGELERQRRVQTLGQLATDRVTDRLRLAFEHPLAHHQTCLHPQQLVERQPAPGLLLLGDRLRGVDGSKRRVACDQPETTPRRVGNRVGDPARRRLPQRILDPSGDLPRHQRGLLALRIHGHDATGAIADQVDDRIGHLQPAPIHLGLAEQRDLQSLAELLLAPRLIEEHHLQSPAAVADDRIDHRAPIAHRPLRHTSHTDQHQRLLARQQITDPRLVGAIHPTPRIGRQQIEHGVDADIVQRRQLLLADALDPLDADRVEVTQRQRFGHSTPKRYGYRGWPPRCTSTCTSGRCSTIHASNASV